jgi:hypothetical protein
MPMQKTALSQAFDWFTMRRAKGKLIYFGTDTCFTLFEFRF